MLLRVPRVAALCTQVRQIPFLRLSVAILHQTGPHSNTVSIPLRHPHILQTTMALPSALPHGKYRYERAVRARVLACATHTVALVPAEPDSECVMRLCMRCVNGAPT